MKMYLSHSGLYLAAFLFFAVSQADDIHLLKQPSEVLQELIVEEFGNVTLPCPSSSSYVKVLLYKNGKILVPNTTKYDGIVTNVKYNFKYGFLLQTVTKRSAGLYMCLALYKNNSNSAIYKLNIIPSLKKPVIKKIDGHSDFVTEGQNVKLKCSVKMDLKEPYTLNWRIDNDDKFNVKNIQYSRVHYSTFLKNGVYWSDGSHLLKIQNVSSQNEGRYVCELIVNSKLMDHDTYVLQVHTHNVKDTYLNLSVQGGVQEMVIKEGTSEVELIIDIAANPKPILFRWNGPDGKVVEGCSEKMCIKNNTSTSKLIIKDVELFDSGVYELFVTNYVYVKRITVSLFVESKPIVKGIYTAEPTGDVDVPFSYGCEVYGYPMPSFEWGFKDCIEDLECQNSNLKIKNTSSTVVITNKIIHTLKFYISYNINATGVLMCRASNIFGNAYKTLTVWVEE